MSSFRKMWRRVLRFFGFLPEAWAAVYMDEPPDHLIEEAVYLVGENGFLWCAVLKCPCGCGTSVSLNLLPQVRPRWICEVDQRRRITLSPSIWRKEGCRSHFFLRDSKIQWYQDFPA